MSRKRVSKPTARVPEPSYWKVVAIIAIIFSTGLAVKLVFYPTRVPAINSGTTFTPTSTSNYQAVSQTNDPIDSHVKLVAANFRCACGGCGELFLVDCTCDMPRGAKEEKTFIREQLQKGLTVDQVITLVEQEYGHRI
ncbi:MAG: hypothetical protein JRF72_20605 [Deltaproteobacteria bacterium]|jgi:hypothetical protein|nr:hypothetical protein [Deltaproteobacteria bacterium]